MYKRSLSDKIFEWIDEHDFIGCVILGILLIVIACSVAVYTPPCKTGYDYVMQPQPIIIGTQIGITTQAVPVCRDGK